MSDKLAVVICIFVMLSLLSHYASAAPEDIYYEDTFAVANHDWKFDRNNWLFRDGVLAHDTYTIGTALYTKGFDWTNYEINTKIRVTKFGNENGSKFIFFRTNEVWNGYGLAITPTAILLSRYDGAWNERVILGQMGNVAKQDSWMKIKIQIQANQIKVYVDDKLRINTFDPDNKFTQGSIAFYCDYSTAEVDSVKITELEPLEVKVSNKRIITSILDEDDSKWPGYKGPFDEKNARHIILYYTHRTWSSFDLLPYVAYGKRTDTNDIYSNKYEDWFFDTFLLLNIYGDNRTNPTNITHWYHWLDLLYGEGKNLDSLNQAVDLARDAGLDDQDYKAKVILMIPYPSVEQKDFGDLDNDGVSEDFSKRDNRIKAVNWFISEALKLFNPQRFNNLELIGFYWFEEGLSGSDGALVREASSVIHEHGLSLYWIPMYDANGISNHQRYGFDSVMMQPNYLWGENLKIDRLEKAAAMARKYNMGLEIEVDGNVTKPSYEQRFYEYLDMGVHLGYMDNALISYYEGGGGLLDFYKSSNEKLYNIYTAIYEFVKGKYKPSRVLEYK